MSDISDLKQRVQAVGDRFGQLADQDRNYSTRLTSLLAAVEEGISRTQEHNKQLSAELARSKEEAARLAGELARAKGESGDLTSRMKAAEDENAQLRSMVQTLLAAVEEGGDAVLSQAMQDLESRIDRIVSGDVAERAEAPENGESSEADVGPDSAADPEAADTEADSAESEPKASDPAEDEPALDEEDPAEAPLELTPDMEVVEESDPLAAADAEVAETDEEPADETSTDAEAEAEKAADAEAEDTEETADGESEATDIPVDGSPAPSGAPSDDDLTAVNKIIQRISLLTGEFVDPEQQAAPANNGVKKDSASEDGGKAKGESGSRPSDGK